MSEATKAEAAQRFERGLQLFESQDNAGALAQFKRTYELIPNPVVLYNIGLVFAAMARPVDAVDSLESAIKSGGLPADKLERAQQTLSDQLARVGRLTVTTTPDGARIEVDNVVVAKTPLEHPIRVSEGTHVVGAVAEGFAPSRKEVVIAGNAEASLHLELVPTEGKRLANLTVRTATVGADVYVDGERVGKTPLATSTTLVAGHHVVELRRPGYVTARREVDVGEGATGELAFELPVDPAALGVEGATLVLDASEANVEVTVDGERKGLYSAPLRLPRGAHRISLTRAGFLPIERDILLDGGQTNFVRAVFQPTTETRERYESRVSFHRTWGWVGIAGGALIAGGSAALVVISPKQQSEAQGDLDAINAKYQANEAPCDFRDGFASQPGGMDVQCKRMKADATNKVSSAKTQGLLGFVGIGVGGAVAVTGLVLLLTGDDPDRYDQPGPSAHAQARGPKIALVPGPGEIGYGLRVTF